MMLKTTKMDVWAAPIDDAPGGLAKLLRALADHGVDLDSLLARREGAMKGKGVVFLAPRHGGAELHRLEETGLHAASHTATLKIEGEDRPGLGAELVRVIADAGVNLHGLTANVIGHKFVCYASFDSVADLERADKALQTVDTERFPRLRAAMRRAMRDRAVTH